MAIEPSPIAEATRFTDPYVTSPTANTPGTLVSNCIGGRSKDHPGSQCPSRKRSWPVRLGGRERGDTGRGSQRGDRRRHHWINPRRRAGRTSDATVSRPLILVTWLERDL